MEVVTALASMQVPENEVMTDVSTELTDRSEVDRASKWSRRKEKMLCYRRGGKGHFIAECVAMLCDTCGKLAHDSAECPLLQDQAPSLMMYGVYCAELTFFESPNEREVSDESTSMTTGIVKVTRGEVSETQIMQRLRELAPGEFQWDLVSLVDRMFKVEFPFVEDLQMLLSFGMCKVPTTDGILEFQEWKLVEPQGKLLTQAWLRFSGAPSRPLQDARVMATMGILVGKPEHVDMEFTRAHGIARVLASILNIEYVPEVVKWAYRGRIYDLVIEFEDESLLVAPAHDSDVDMHEGDGGAGVREPPVEDPGRQLSKGPGPELASTGDGTVPPTVVPSTTLRFGSFEHSSAPPKLWSDRIESEEAFELELPALRLEGAVDTIPGGRQVATPSRAQHMVPPQEVTQLVVPGLSGGALGQAASGCYPSAEEGDSGQVAPVSFSSPGGGLGQGASDTSSPVASTFRLMAALPSGEGSGQVASELSPPSAPLWVASPVLGGERGQMALVRPPPPTLPASPGGALHKSAVFVSACPLSGEVVGEPVQLDRPAGWGAAGGRTPTAISREEVIAFGGIQDPVFEGRRVSGRLQTQPDVDDIQQRCAMRAAKLRDVEVTTGMSVNTSNSILHFSNDEIVQNANQLGVSLGSNDTEISNSINDLLDLEAERALEMIRNIAAVKLMSDSEVDALGVRVLDNFCADLMQPNTDEDVEADSTEIVLASPSETGCEDQLQSQTVPKRKWKRKVYPVSAVRRSARIRTAKKFHDEL
ncbi:uncharacterized protein [Triticum aestivum]|uniref:uncharacterized protein isoform X1 n=1 Tax=Triticum aestivum TaxID=4565 RepID=UPI001D00B16F|nr:uncharacterized protein LOC123137051 isoform X1 [Triticum aestivum]